MILWQMSEVALPPVASETVATLMQASEPGLEAIADRVLEGDLTNIFPQELPFIAAALQVYWMHMASSLKEHAFGRLKQSGLCPVCGHGRPPAPGRRGQAEPRPGAGLHLWRAAA